MSCKAYVACRMTGRDKKEQVQRARYVCAILRQYNVEGISPVLFENVEETPGPLVNTDKERLRSFWSRDKQIIREEAHVVLVDGAHDKSFGVEREYMLNRGCLWKPTVLLCPPMGLTVADFEDDKIVHDVHAAGAYIRDNWGTWEKRFVWRIKMLARTLPSWIWYQILAFR